MIDSEVDSVSTFSLSLALFVIYIFFQFHLQGFKSISLLSGLLGS